MMSRKCKTHIVKFTKNLNYSNDSSMNIQQPNECDNSHSTENEITQDYKKQKIFKSRYVKTLYFFKIIS